MNACKTCQSPHRNEIESMILNGLSANKVSGILKQKYNVIISYKGIGRHMENHASKSLKAAQDDRDLEPGHTGLDEINAMIAKCKEIRDDPKSTKNKCMKAIDQCLKIYSFMATMNILDREIQREEKITANDEINIRVSVLNDLYERAMSKGCSYELMSVIRNRSTQLEGEIGETANEDGRD